jgi:outer membrane lipoprotein carrier protein
LSRYGALLALSLIVKSPTPDVGRPNALDSLIERLQQRYSSVQSVAAHFTQTYRAPGVEQVESGEMCMKKPGLMRWEYNVPEIKLFITDEKSSYLYTPEDRQVLISSFSAADLRSTPLQFLLGQGRIAESFTYSLEAKDKPKLRGTVLIRLTPRSQQGEYDYVLVECDEKTVEVKRLVIYEVTGSTSEFAFSHLVTNPKLDNSKFRFKIPKGVEVIRIDDKD